MPDHISPLDDDYISLGRAATLIAQGRPRADPSQVLDMFKRAIFSGELDPPPFGALKTREHPANWLHMEIEAPKCELSQDQAALPIRPRKLYGVNRETVASVLLTTNALPGGAQAWWAMFNVSMPIPNREDAFEALVAIPLREFPQRAHRELEAILIPVHKLALWLGQQGERIPAFLLGSLGAKEPDQASAQPERAETPAVRSQGRPQKAAWPRVVQLVHQLRGQHPDWQKKKLAYEAWQIARAEFSESELPSVATIQRSMAEILEDGSAD